MILFQVVGGANRFQTFGLDVRFRDSIHNVLTDTVSWSSCFDGRVLPLAKSFAFEAMLNTRSKESILCGPGQCAEPWTISKSGLDRRR